MYFIYRELEDYLLQRTLERKVAKTQNQKKLAHNFDKFSSTKLNDLFDNLSKSIIKKIQTKSLPNPLILSAGTKKLMDFILFNITQVLRNDSAFSSNKPNQQMGQAIEKRLAYEVSDFTRTVLFEMINV